MGKKSRRQREKDPRGTGLRKVLRHALTADTPLSNLSPQELKKLANDVLDSQDPTTENIGRASGGASVGAAESNMLFRNRESGFVAGAARRDTAMRRVSARTGPSTSSRA